MKNQMNPKSKNLTPKFLLIWFGQFISMIGSGLTRERRGSGLEMTYFSLMPARS